jgi:hypothetical protein
MIKLFCLIALQFFVCLSFCQKKKRVSIVSDSITTVIENLPEYQELYRNGDSTQRALGLIGGMYFPQITVAIHCENDSVFDNIADAYITKKNNEIDSTIYTIKYDIKLQKIVSFKKEK